MHFNSDDFLRGGGGRRKRRKKKGLHALHQNICNLSQFHITETAFGVKEITVFMRCVWKETSSR
jgi:hypothetical protein